jgi:hypothetical protein
MSLSEKEREAYLAQLKAKPVLTRQELGRLLLLLTG